ncbi:MAG: SAM-dependent methyltransferase, partial [Fluviicola sp.]|nr:SAM-dependent methyltransferase [Fluviicola sp.]
LFGLDYPDWLRKAGFTVTEFDKEANYSEEDRKRFRLDPKEVLYIVSK